MMLQYSPLVFSLAAGTIFLALLAIYAGKRRHLPGVFPIFVFFLAATIWSGTYALSIATADLDTNIVLNCIAFPAIVAIPVICLIFTLWYTERDVKQSRLFLTLVFVIPVVSVILDLTNPLHNMIYAGFFQMVGPRGEILWYFQKGPLFWLTIAYSLVMVLFSIFLLVLRYRSVGAIFRTQIQLLLLTIFLPLITFGAYLLDLGPIPGLDLTPLALAVSGLALMAATLYFELFSLQPLTHTLVVNTLQDPVIATSRDGAVILMNPAAESIIGINQHLASGALLTNVRPDLGRYLELPDSPDQHLPEYTLKQGDSDRIYDVRSVLIQQEAGADEGNILTFRDITDRRNAENALLMANRKLKILTSIVRHDIKNRLTALNLFLDLASEEEDKNTIREDLNQAKNSAEGILSLVNFTQKYENIGASGPSWHRVGTLLEKAKNSLDTTNIQVVDETGSLEIFADPLIEGVFYNLLDNALRYAEGMTIFRAGYRRAGEALILVIEDNGPGVSQADKEKIFERGYGKNTGMGLFLVREILGITGMTIRETGTEETGAKFEILVSPGHFRFL